MSKKHIITLVAVAVVVGGIGFFGGMKYAQAHASSTRAALRGSVAGAGFAGRGAGGANGAGFVNGQILSKDATSITVKTNSGSKIILLAGSTTISKAAAGTVDDLAVGINILATGTANSDGSVTAQNIQIRPAGTTPPGQPGQ